jgi:UDPglucose--hexose-1-phosphate uridylyltransferase
MPEFHRDPILDRWTILAENRALRPNQFANSATSHDLATCPFCAGHEDLTPASLRDYHDPAASRGEAPWQVRVVPNKYPALEPDAHGSPRSEPLFESLPGAGAHEVIIESPRHVVQACEWSVAEAHNTLRACQNRILFWQQNAPWSYPLWFKNVGQAAGASLAHFHSQLIVLPMVPTLVREELSGALRFFHRYDQCVFCRMIAAAVESADHRVFTTADFIVLCPPASRFPYETWILPRNHASHFQQAGPDCIEQLAEVLRKTLTAIERAAQQPAYNVLLHTAPFDTQELPHYHWHMEVLPRTAHLAGFELGTGFAINTVPPCEAARRLKDYPF